MGGGSHPVGAGEVKVACSVVGKFLTIPPDSFRANVGHPRDLMMNLTPQTKLSWIEPEIVELDVVETAIFPRLGADVGGNPYPDCQRS
jgi:hypothetical protein